MNTQKNQNYNIDAILSAIKLFKTAEKFARAIDVSYSTVLNWKSGRFAPSPLNCLKIENITQGQIKKESILTNYDWKNL